jgi:apolipoprotein N-acyltransferase
MKSLNAYRFAGLAGGLMLAAGQFFGAACLLQTVALLPLMLLVLRHRRLSDAALAGLYMGLAFTFPQMIYLRMPVPVTVVLLIYFTILLILLCTGMAYFLPCHPVLGPLAFGALWYILDWANYTLIPVWGMAQSFARSWTAFPWAIQFISVTGISGVLFVIGAVQGLAAHAIYARHGSGKLCCSAMIASGAVVMTAAAFNLYSLSYKPEAMFKVAAAGWVFDDRSAEIDPHSSEGFENLFAQPAGAAAEKGAKLFTTGEMGFYIADHERAAWNERFGDIARQTGMWLVVGYYNISLEENRLFFMSPEGQIVHEYTKTHLTPFEPGRKGNGDLKLIELDGIRIGAMICQDDNFSTLTRRCGRRKAGVVLCPTADWWTIKDAHLQAVRARAIEGRYGIARGAACGISAIISPHGYILAKRGHYKAGPGVIAADIPVYSGVTFFSRFGHVPSLLVAAAILAAVCIGAGAERATEAAGNTPADSVPPRLRRRAGA